MATYYSDLGTLQNATTNVRNRADGGLIMGKVRIAQGLISTTNGGVNAAAGDVFNICQLPKGAKVIPSLCKVESEALGTGVSLKFGDNDVATADDDRYSAAFSCASAGTKSFTSGVAGLTPFATTSDQTWIQAVVVDGGSISVTASKTAMVLIAYLLP